MQIIPITADELIHYWDEIRADIKKVESRTETDYLPIDVLREIKSNRAMAAVIENDGHHIGSLVLRFLHEEFTQKPILHVWVLALSKPGYLDDVWDFVKQTAKLKNINTIQVISDRRGWGRRLKRYGFKELQYRAYHRELNDG